MFTESSNQAAFILEEAGSALMSQPQVTITFGRNGQVFFLISSLSKSWLTILPCSFIWVRDVAGKLSFQRSSVFKFDEIWRRMRTRLNWTSAPVAESSFSECIGPNPLLTSFCLIDRHCGMPIFFLCAFRLSLGASSVIAL